MNRPQEQGPPRSGIISIEGIHTIAPPDTKQPDMDMAAATSFPIPLKARGSSRPSRKAQVISIEGIHIIAPPDTKPPDMGVAAATLPPHLPFSLDHQDPRFETNNNKSTTTTTATHTTNLPYSHEEENDLLQRILGSIEDSEAAERAQAKPTMVTKPTNDRWHLPPTLRCNRSCLVLLRARRPVRHLASRQARLPARLHALLPAHREQPVFSSADSPICVLDQATPDPSTSLSTSSLHLALLQDTRQGLPEHFPKHMDH